MPNIPRIAICLLFAAAVFVDSGAEAKTIRDISSSPMSGKLKLKIPELDFKAKYKYEYVFIQLNIAGSKVWSTSSFEEAPDLNASGSYKLKNSRKAKFKAKAATVLELVALLESYIEQSAAAQGRSLDVNVTGIDVRKAVYKVDRDFEDASFELDVRFDAVVNGGQGVPVSGRLWTPKAMKSMFISEFRQ